MYIEFDLSRSAVPSIRSVLIRAAINDCNTKFTKPYRIKEVKGKEIEVHFDNDMDLYRFLFLFNVDYSFLKPRLCT